MTCLWVVSIQRIALALAPLPHPSCLLLQLMGVSLMGNKVALLFSELKRDLPENHLSHRPTARNATIMPSPPERSPPVEAVIAPKEGNNYIPKE